MGLDSELECEPRQVAEAVGELNPLPDSCDHAYESDGSPHGRFKSCAAVLLGDAHTVERPGSPTPGQWCSIVNRDAIPAFGAVGLLSNPVMRFKFLANRLASTFQQNLPQLPMIDSAPEQPALSTGGELLLVYRHICASRREQSQSARPEVLRRDARNQIEVTTWANFITAALWTRVHDSRG